VALQPPPDSAHTVPLHDALPILTTLIAPHMHRLKRLFLALDAMGLVAFSLIGCDIALRMGYALPVVIMAGMITGICGGVLRDVRSEEHTSELQSRENLVCRPLLE